MYNEFKLVDSEYISGNYEIYSNGLLIMFVDFYTDNIRIAKCQTFDRWSNTPITQCSVPYTKSEYEIFENLLYELTAKALGKAIISSTTPHKKLTFIRIYNELFRNRLR